MKIGWFLTAWGALGGIRSVIETGNALIRAGHDFYVLGNVGKHKSPFCEDLIPNENHINFPMSYNEKDAAKLCNRVGEFDMLFNQDPVTMSFSELVNSKIKVIHYCGADGEMYRQFINIEGVRTACSHKLVKAAENHDTENKHKKYYIGQGVNFNEFNITNMETSRYYKYRDNDKINVICCGTRGGLIKSNKGAYDIIEASKILDKDKYSFLYFDLTKQGCFPSYFKCIETIAQQKTLNEVYAISDIVVAPDYVSAWNCCAGEGMACGKPVIASTKGSDDFGIDGETCLIYRENEEDSPKFLAEKIEYLANNSDIAKNIAENGHNNIKNFTWGNVASRIINIAKENGIKC